MVGWALSPLYGLSPRLWAGSAFALDSLRVEAESRVPGDEIGRPLKHSTDRPQVYRLFGQLSTRGGLTVGRITRRRAHQYVDVTI